MRALTEQIPVDRILYASNYPFDENSRILMAELKESGIVGKEEWEGIAWKNAEKLFGLNARGAKMKGVVVGRSRRASLG